MQASKFSPKDYANVLVLNQTDLEKVTKIVKAQLAEGTDVPITMDLDSSRMKDSVFYQVPGHFESTAYTRC